MNIVILGASALATAQRLKSLYPQAVIHGLRGRADGAERHYDDFGEHLRALYRAGQPLLVLCAAGIVIRSLAALLAEKAPSRRYWPWPKTAAPWCRCSAAWPGSTAWPARSPRTWV